MANKEYHLTRISRDVNAEVWDTDVFFPEKKSVLSKCGSYSFYSFFSCSQLFLENLAGGKNDFQFWKIHGIQGRLKCGEPC